VTEVTGDVAASFSVAAAALATATATPPEGRRCGDVVVAAHAPLPAVHGRAVVPLPPPHLSSLSTESFRGPPCVLVGLGDQNEMGPWNERDSMTKDTLLFPFVALCFLAVHCPSELSYTISLPPLSYEPVGMCVSSAPSMCTVFLHYCPPLLAIVSSREGPVLSPSASLAAPDCQLIGRTSACRSHSLGDRRSSSRVNSLLEWIFSLSNPVMALSSVQPRSVLALCAVSSRAWQEDCLVRASPPRAPRLEHDSPSGLHTCSSRASLAPRGFMYCGSDRWLFAVVVVAFHLRTAAPLPPSTPPPHQPPPSLPSGQGFSCTLL